MITIFNDMVTALPQQFQLERYETTYLCDYICDTVDDLADLPEDCEMGSVARVLSPLSIYRKHSNGEWVLQASLQKGS